MIEGQQVPVFIIGHKNPDTDSICSAIAYENLNGRAAQLKIDTSSF